MGAAMVAELRPHLTFDPERAGRVLDAHLLDAWPMVLVVVEDDVPLGFLVAQKEDYLACSGFFIGQGLFYVQPVNRGSRAAATLFAAFARWAKSLNPEEIFAGIGAGTRSKAAARWLRQFGFEPSGQQIMHWKAGSNSP